MKKLVFILFLFTAVQSFGQNRFPSIDSAKAYTLRYYRNSTVETFTNLRGQNIAYGTLELIDSLAGNAAVDSIWLTGGAPDTLRYRKAGTTYTVGTISGGGSSIDTTSLSNRINLKLNISDTAAMLSPYLRSNIAAATYQPVLISGTNIKTVNGNTLLGSGDLVISGGASVPDSITEKHNYYFGEFIVGATVNTGTGAITRTGTDNMTDYLPIEGSTAVTISVKDGYDDVTIYGWTYDTTLTPISEIRSNALIGTKTNTYTFTTPSNARYISIYTKYAGQDFGKALSIKSYNDVTYAIPIKPESFSGSKSVPIQSAINFARWKSAGVELTGDYLVDSSLILYSGTTLILNNAHLKLDSGSKTNVIRNEAVARPDTIFARGNRYVNIYGIGKAVIEGSDEDWSFINHPDTDTWRVIALLFANVSDFNVKGVTFKNTNGWAASFEQSRIGLIDDIILMQDSSKPNQDGINLRAGTNRVTVSNVKGYTWDDIVALTNLKYAADSIQVLGGTTNYQPYKTNFDIEKIIIRNIQRDTSGIFGPAFYKAGILLLCEDSLKVHDVSIDGVTGPQQIQLGFTSIDYSVTTEATIDDMYNISVSNTDANILMARQIKNSSFTNIAATTRLGVKNADLVTGSRNIYRKYHNLHPEYYDSTFSTNFLYEHYGSNAIEGFKIKTTNSAGISQVGLFNPTNQYGYFRQYPATGAGDGYASSTSVQANKKLIFVTDVDVASGGTSNMEFRVGGNLATTTRLTLGASSAAFTVPLTVSQTTAVFDGYTVSSSSTTGAPSFVTTNNASVTGFFRTYGSAFSLSHLQSRSAFGSTGSIAVFSDGGVGSGGANNIVFYSGGFNSNQERLRISSAGVAIGTQATATSTLQTTSFATAYTATATSLGLSAVHHTVNVTATGQTITLPTAVGISGREYTIVYTGASGSCTIATTSSQTFLNITSNPTSLTLDTPAAGAIVSYTVMSTGAHWIVTGKVKNE